MIDRVEADDDQPRAFAQTAQQRREDAVERRVHGGEARRGGDPVHVRLDRVVGPYVGVRHDGEAHGGGDRDRVRYHLRRRVRGDLGTGVLHLRNGVEDRVDLYAGLLADIDDPGELEAAFLGRERGHRAA